MRPQWIFPGIVCLSVGILAFFTASEIEVQVGLVPFLFAFITLIVTGAGMVTTGIIVYFTNRF